MDPGAFERLAADVLRMADPRYTSLIETGTNVDGRAVVSPVDGIAVGRSGARTLLFQHTTTRSRGLRRKWLGPDGDLPKAMAIARSERERGAPSPATLVLATSDEPGEDLVRDAFRSAGTELEVDIWSASRIVAFLDNDPEGQWLRRRHLGFAETRLSASALRAIGRESVAGHLPLVPRDTLVNREIDRDFERLATRSRGAVFVVGESGQGKSVACRKLADRWTDAGNVALVVPHEVVEGSPTLGIAVANTLRLYAPELHSACGDDALALATADAPLLLVVEDVNLARDPAQVLDRLLGWSAPGEKAGAGHSRWLLLCPVWRSNTGPDRSARRERVEANSLSIGSYSRHEAVHAIDAAARARGLELTPVEAEELAHALDDDPLLIGLNRDWANPTPSSALRSYVEQGLTDAANDDLPAELRLALDRLAAEALRSRDHSPTWSSVRAWFASDPGLLPALKRLLAHGAIARLGPPREGERLLYRHDRLRDHLLAGALRALIEAGELEEGLWSDPAYAKLLGVALLDLPEGAVHQTVRLNPPALCAALAEKDLLPDRRALLHRSIEDWMASEDFRDPRTEARRHHAMTFLAEVDDPFVLSVVAKFPVSFPELEAAFRNGSAAAGARYCYSFDPYLTYPSRDRLVTHAVSRHPGLVRDLAALISDGKVVDKRLAGALFLAGEIGDPWLSSAIAARWRRSGNTIPLHSSWLWAALMCCSSPHHPILDELTAAWAALPEKVESDGRDRNPRWDVAGHDLPWALARRPNPAAISFLVDLAKMRPELDWVIGNILSHVDTVQAVTDTIDRYARMAERAERNGTHFHFGFALERQWRPDRHGRVMSAAGREAAASVWRDKSADRHRRRAAFLLWSQTAAPAEIAELYGLEADPVLADDALRTRLDAGDRSAVALLRERLKTAEWPLHWWYQARGVGLDSLRIEVEEIMAKRRELAQGKELEADHVIAKMLMDRRDDYAISIIRENWKYVRGIDDYVQAALFIADPGLVELAHEALHASDDPATLLKYLSMGWGVKTFGRPGVTDFAQLQAITAWLPQIDEMCRMDLFEAANRLGKVEWRKRHLDALLPSGRGCCGGTVQDLLCSLDEELARPGRDEPNLHHWFKRRLKETWTRAELIDAVGRWAGERGSRRAALALISAVEEFGRRTDVALLDGPAASHGEDVAVRACNARYNVVWRSLE